MPRIQIEDKHIYNTLPQRALYTDFSRQGSTVDVTPNIVINKLAYPVKTQQNLVESVERFIHHLSSVKDSFIMITRLDSQQHLVVQLLVLVDSSTVQKIIQHLLVSLVTLAERKFNLMMNSIHYKKKWNISIRHFIIEFDDNSFYSLDNYNSQTYLQDWFRNLVIQTNTNRYPSNTTQVLRESTPYTGTFRILYDKTHHLTPSNTVLHYSYTFLTNVH